MATIKWFRKLIQDYEGQEEKLRSHLLNELAMREATADRL
jgi:hypothetical protein